jgi:hypothetical protein
MLRGSVLPGKVSAIKGDNANSREQATENFGVCTNVTSAIKHLYATYPRSNRAYLAQGRVADNDEKIQLNGATVLRTRWPPVATRHYLRATTFDKRDVRLPIR